MDWKYLLTSFDGRINRAKFWAGVVMMIIINIVANLLDMMLGLDIARFRLRHHQHRCRSRIDLFRARHLRQALARP